MYCYYSLLPKSLQFMAVRISGKSYKSQSHYINKINTFQPYKTQAIRYGNKQSLQLEQNNILNHQFKIIVLYYNNAIFEYIAEQLYVEWVLQYFNPI